jgi:hypothetical protein
MESIAAHRGGSPKAKNWVWSEAAGLEPGSNGSAAHGGRRVVRDGLIRRLEM